MKAQLGIFTTDTKLVVRTWDEWLERVTARSASEVCGRGITEVFPELERRGLAASFRRTLESGAVELLAPAFHGYLIKCPSQTPNRTFQFMQQRTVIAPLRDEMTITGLVVTIEDVTERRERELELVGDLADQDWRTRRQAVEALGTTADQTSVAEFIRRLRKEHRDPSLLNSMLQLLVSGVWETLEPLLDLTKDPDAEVRMYAALALGDLKDRRAIPALRQLLHDGNINVKYHSIEALAKLKASEAVDDLATIAESGEFFLSFPALEALASIGESHVAARLVPLLEREMLRAATIGALAKLGDETIVAPIAALMERPKLVPIVAQALAKLEERYEEWYGEGAYIGDLVRRHTSVLAAQNILEALNNASGETLRAMVRLLGWIADEHVIVALTRLLGSAAVRSEVIETLVRHGKQVVSPLCKQLESEDLEIRRAAISALARIGDPKCVPALVQALADADTVVEAAGALAGIGDGRAYEPILKLLSDGRAAVRQAAVAAIDSLGHPRTLTDIRRLLTDPDSHARESAVRVAGYFGYPECADLMLERAHDPNENVRRAAVENLPHFEDDRILTVLTVSLRDESPKIRGAAAQSLGYVDNAAVLHELIGTLHDPDPWVRYHAGRALGQLRSTEAIDELAFVVRNDTANHVRIAAVDALGAIGGRKTVCVLAPLVDSEDRDLARAALMALGAIGHPDAVQPILTVVRSQNPGKVDAIRAIAVRRSVEAAEALQWAAAADKDPTICEACIEGLSRMATPESILALVRLTADRRLREMAVTAISKLVPAHIEHVEAGFRTPQMEVRRAVIEALGRMRHPMASEMLSKGLDDEQPEVRLAAVLALRRLGNQSSEKKLLHMAHGDPDPGVRKAAEHALER